MRNLSRLANHLVAGCFLLCSGTSGFVFADIQYTVTMIGDGTTRATALNDLGQVVGYGIDGEDMRAFLYENGTVQYLGTLTGSGSSAAYGINNAGQIAGWSYTTANGNPHAIRYSGGQMQDLGTLGGPTSQAGAINNLGHVVGSAAIDSRNPAFIYRDDQMHEIGALGDGLGFANGLGANDSGQVVGVSQLASGGSSHAFLYSDDQMIDLTPQAGTSLARGINNVGQVVGSLDDVAFLYSEGILSELGTLQGEYSQASDALGINDLGIVVGQSSTQDWDSHAFIYENGELKDLNDLIAANSGWVLQTADDINNLGQIVGRGMFDGQASAFLLTPVPEPSSIALWAIVCMACVIFIGRRKGSAGP